MPFRLRYLHHDLQLSEGQFAVGRSAGCQLSLDDPLVSRRHALLVVAKDGVTIEDLQSRNGVNVNGQRITGKTPLHAGDKVVIGSQEMTLLLGRDFTPTNMKVKPLEIRFTLIDPAQVLDQGDKWAKLFDEVIVKQGRK